MSPLWRNHYRFVLSPDRVLLTHRKRSLRDRVEGKATWAIDRGSGAAPSWRASLEVLRRHLPAATKSPATASVVLSSHFCHFALLPKGNALSGRDELRVYARHRMRAKFGEPVGSWALELNNAGDGSGHIASAVDGVLLEEIRALFRERKLQLVSIRPYLAVAFNRCRGALEKRSAWFVVYEDGRVVVSLFNNGNWASLASRRLGPQWTADIFQVLDRERQLVEVQGAECNVVLLNAPELPDEAALRGSRYQVELLRPEIPRILSEGYYAMAA